MLEEENVNLPEFTEQEQGEVDNQVETTPTEPFLKVKYNKEEKALSADEAIEYAQKGMNYDHIKSELESLKGSKSLKLIEKMAEKSGMTTDEYVDYIEEQEEQARIQEMAKKRGIDDDDFAKEFYELKKKAENWETVQKENETKKQAEERATKENIEFLEYYKQNYGKDVVVEEIPKEVYELAKTMPLKSAFIQHEFEKMLKGQAVAKKNEENAQTTPGSIAGDGTSAEIQFTPEMIENMSPREMNKHWNNPLFRKVAGLNKKRAN